MKTLSIMCALVLVLGMVIRSAFAAGFCIDYLETNNPGGWDNSLKTWDKNVPLDVSGTISIDIWGNDFTNQTPELINAGGVLITWDDTQIENVTITAYDSGAGPWMSPFTKVQVVSANSVKVKVGSLSGVAPDTGDDIILCKLQFQCKELGTSTIRVENIPNYPAWQSIESCDINIPGDCYVYDGEMGIEDIGASCRGLGCKTDQECDDGMYCNGEETCIDETCQQGTDPCPGQVCDEDTYSCELTPATSTTIEPFSDYSMTTIPETTNHADPDITMGITPTTITTPSAPNTTSIIIEPNTKKIGSPESEIKLSSKTDTTYPTTTLFSSPYGVAVFPSSVELSSGGVVQFSAKTISDGNEAISYLWKIAPDSSIGSTIDENGLFTAGNNTSDPNIKETVLAYDPLHENNYATVIVTINGKKQLPVGCDLSINIISATVLPGDTIAFSANNFGERCVEGSFEWKTNSKIGSKISTSGLYTAGKNVSGDSEFDIIIVKDTINRVNADAIVTVLPAEKATQLVPATQKPQQEVLSGRETYSTVLIVIGLTILSLICILIFWKIRR